MTIIIEVTIINGFDKNNPRIILEEGKNKSNKSVGWPIYIRMTITGKVSAVITNHIIPCYVVLDVVMNIFL